MQNNIFGSSGSFASGQGGFQFGAPPAQENLFGGIRSQSFAGIPADKPQWPPSSSPRRAPLSNQTNQPSIGEVVREPLKVDESAARQSSASGPRFQATSPAKLAGVAKGPEQNAVQTPVTPVEEAEPGTPAPIKAGIDALRSSMPRKVWHILGWRNPAETLVIAGSCVMGIIGVQYLSRGGLGITLVEGIAYFMLIKLAIGFMSSTLGAAAPGGAKLWDTTIDNVAGALRAAAQGYESLINNKDPRVTLAVTLGLWGVLVVGRHLSPVKVAWLILGLSFSIAPLWTYSKDAIKQAWSSAAASMSTQMERMRITRKHRTVAMLGLVALFWLYAGWVQRGISLLVALEVIRCQMSDSDVESFARAVGPMTNTVHKHISRGQGWAQDTFQRSAAKVGKSSVSWTKICAPHLSQLNLFQNGFKAD